MSSNSKQRFVQLQEANRLYSQAINETRTLIALLDSGSTSPICLGKIQSVMDQVSRIEETLLAEDAGVPADSDINDFVNELRRTGVNLLQLLTEAEAKAGSLKISIASQMEELSRGF